jgi:putative transposase
MDGQRTFDDYRMPDELWEQMEEILPEYPSSPKGGRPRAYLRSVADAIFYRLRTGCQWKAIPPELAPGSTAHDYYQHWAELGIFEQLWDLAVQVYDDLIGLERAWQSVDCAMTKAPLGGEKTGKNPTDRGKLGAKRSLQTDGNGIPIGLAIGGANTHDTKLLQETIEDSVERAVSEVNEEEHLCLDKAYDNPTGHGAVAAQGYQGHIRRIGEEKLDQWGEKKHPARRWVVERTLAWLSKCRAILVRYDKKACNYLALLQLACSLIWYRRWWRLRVLR